MKSIVVLPAYNAEKTLEKTYQEIKDVAHSFLLVDDASTDKTAEVAKKLGIPFIRHNQNKGYGANQKTCYRCALEQGAEIIVMIHPDYQYEGRVIPQMINLIRQDKADFVLGSRMFGRNALKGGMPIWKYAANRVLTCLQNRIYKRSLSEYHTGLRAYHRRVLEKVDFLSFSDDFVFDSEMIAAAIANGFRIREVYSQCRYFKDASSIGFRRSIVYGASSLWVLIRYCRGQYGQD